MLLGRTTRARAPQLADDIRAWVNSLHPDGVIGALHALANRPDSTSTLPTISVPTLVVVGDEDQVTPPEGMRLMAEAIPHAAFTTIARAGHLSPLEQPDSFQRIAWLVSHPGLHACGPAHASFVSAPVEASRTILHRGLSMPKAALLGAFDSRDAYQVSLPPLGLGYLISYARKWLPNWEVRFFRSLDDAVAWKPDVVGISRGHRAVCRRLGVGNNGPGISWGVPVLLGGVHITALPHRLAPQFDAGIIGEGEATFCDILRLIERVANPGASDWARVEGIVYHDGGTTARTPARKLIARLDDLPWPDRDALGHDWAMPTWRQVHVVCSRGCPFDCAFCASGKLWSGFRHFSPEYVAAEVHHLRSRFDPVEIYFFDDLMVGDRKWFGRLVELLTSRHLHEGVVFRAYARANLVDDEIGGLFARAHFASIDIGFESNSRRVLDYYGKRGVTPEINQRALDTLHRHGVSVGASMIIGAPVETFSDAMESLTFVEANAAAGKIDRLSAGLLSPMPGTRVWDEAMAQGVVSETMDWSLLGFNGLPMEQKDIAKFPLMHGGMSSDELWTAYCRFHSLMEIVGARGEGRFWFDRYREEKEKTAAAKAELKRMHGSRLIRAAGAARRLMGRR